MAGPERRRRRRIGWLDSSIRSKALVVVLAPTLVLGAAGAAAAWLTADPVVRALELAALVAALGLGLLMWHRFTTGVVDRLRQLERDTARLEGADPSAELPRGRDEIGRLAARLEEAAEQVRAHSAAADERRSMLESIFHASPDTIVVRDTKGRVVLASSALAGIPGAPDVGAGDEGGDAASAEQLVESAYRYGRLRRDDLLALHHLIERTAAGERDLEPVVTTTHPRTANGGVSTVETRARPIFDQHGAVTGTVTISRDITGRVELERSLRRATTSAQRASEAKSQFLSRMSHELRTPLNAVLGFAQLLELDELSEEQAASLDQIQKAGRHLLSLINEVLDIARIEAGQLTVTTEPVDVGDVLEEVTALLRPMAEGAAVHMMIDPGAERACWVRADRQRLAQVLLNLGSNAVKYNEPGGTVAFRAQRIDGGRLRIAVHDTGPGIDPERQDQLFVPFARLGAERTEVEGTGVGLALSKQLVEVMGGVIGMESTPGRGSMFYVDLHLAPAGAVGPVASPDPATRPVPADDCGPSQPSGDGLDRLVVLHVEDNPSNAALVAHVLARRPGVRLLAATDGGAGLELARAQRPDLVLLDLNLPDMGGAEVLARIKAEPQLADMKIVVVSADATPDRIRHMLDLGVDGYLTKPVAVEALLQLVDDQVGRRAPTRT